jgi:hypothetical protein
MGSWVNAMVDRPFTPGWSAMSLPRSNQNPSRATTVDLDPGCRVGNGRKPAGVASSGRPPLEDGRPKGAVPAEGQPGLEPDQLGPPATKARPPWGT